jgi:hypothetical protein
MKNAYIILVGNHDKTTQKSYTYRDANNKINLRETGLTDVNWLHLAQDTHWQHAFVDIIMNFQVTSHAGGSFLTC